MKAFNSGDPLKLAVIGLGYVGLPLAVAFGRRYQVIGFDTKAERIRELGEGRDRTLELSEDELKAAGGLKLTSDVTDLQGCNVFIVTVPTPIDQHNQPDLTALRRASQSVGGAIRAKGVVIYESTVYPGATEEICIPIIEEISGLALNESFFAGYSPERANPGDRVHRLEKITKVTSGSTPEAADFVDGLYASIIPAGTFKAASIRVAEAAKVIENTQRDLNIALVNEFALIFDKLGIDTLDVLEAAGTKWNFLPFRPGLVGGHCIGVDPYYLTHKAQAVGYHPEVILAGRRINDGMGRFVVSQLVKTMIRRRIQVEDARVLVLGLAFKENCPDLRNTRVIDIVRELRELNVRVDVHDPWVDPHEAQEEYGLSLTPSLEPGAYDAVILAVAHDVFRNMGAEGIAALRNSPAVICDLKGVLPKGAADLRL